MIKLGNHGNTCTRLTIFGSRMFWQRTFSTRWQKVFVQLDIEVTNATVLAFQLSQNVARQLTRLRSFMTWMKMKYWFCAAVSTRLPA